MASPINLVSSPFPPTTSRINLALAPPSSPNFPSLQELGSQNPNTTTGQHVLGAAVAPVEHPSAAASTLVSTVAPHQKGQTRCDETGGRAGLMADASVIEISTPHLPKLRKPRTTRKASSKADPGILASSDLASVRAAKSTTKSRAPKKKPVETAKKSQYFENDRKRSTKAAAVVTETKDDSVPELVSESTHASTSAHINEPKPASRKMAAKKSRQNNQRQDFPLEQGLGLEPAVARRKEWTPPPPDSVDGIPPSQHSDFAEILSSASRQQAAASRRIFNKLQETFAFDSQDETPVFGRDGAPLQGTDIFRKRKLIEMVSTGAATETAPDPVDETLEVIPREKGRAVKRKARTITELATAAYVVREEISAVRADAALAPNRPGQPTKRATKPRKKPAPKKPEPILLSPNTATRQVSNQDFVFGTSSQLAVEHDVRLLRDLQTAMRRSNAADHAVFAIDTPINSDAIEPPEALPRLWGAAARDAEGDLVDFEIVDLVNSPASCAPQPSSDPFGYVSAPQKVSSRTMKARTAPTLPEPIHDHSFPDVSELLGPSDPSKLVKETLVAKPTASSSNIFTACDEDFPDAVILASSHPTVAPKPIDRVSKSQPSSKPTNPNPSASQANLPEQRPKYELFTDAQLAKSVTSFGFKPIRRRTAMISLLTRCWDSKHPAATYSYSTLAANEATIPGSAPLTATSATTTAPQCSTATTTTTTTTKRLRGRPRKNSTSSIDPLEPPPSAQPRNSPPPSFSTPPRRRGRPPRKDPQPSTPSKRKLPSTKSLASQIPILEIPDSDDSTHETASLASPVPSFSSPPISPTFSSPYNEENTLPTQPDQEQEQSLLGTPQTSLEAELHTFISSAITSAPRSTDPSTPSWHEKILLYDPIVLEDLAAWLNMGQLGRVGYDGEVSPGDVKRWCEAKSICCLWRERVGGKERKRL